MFISSINSIIYYIIIYYKPSPNPCELWHQVILGLLSIISLYDIYIHFAQTD